jgi:hypothetical protein
MIGCDLSTKACRDAVPIFLNKDLLAVNQVWLYHISCGYHF